MFGVGTGELLLILVVILLLFGANRLPAAMTGLGKGIKEFKKAVRGDDDAPAAQGPVPEMSLMDRLRADLGKRAVFQPDGTLEVGGKDGSTLTDVDASWAVLRNEQGTERIPLAAVKRVVYRA